MTIFNWLTRISGFTLIELTATLFGLACVALTIRQSVWSWPAGLVQVVLYAWVFYQAKLYSDVGLHLVYVVLQFYGWYRWTRGGATNRADAVPITRLPPRGWTVWLSPAAAGTAALGTVMHRYTDAAVPYWDAAIAVVSLVATVLLARKVLENWLLWIAVDVLAIGVYYAKELYITTGLYAVFLGMATAGWFAWRKSYRRQVSAGSAPAWSSASSSPPRAATSSSSTSPAATSST